MTTFVAVHGAFFGGWSWKPVAVLMEAQGHTFFRPTLTGCAEREHVGSPQVNLTTHVRDIVSLLELEELDDIVLVGHSYAGAVITAVAQQAHQRIRGMVYLDALMPQDGERPRDSFPAAVYDRGEALAAEQGDGWKVPCFLPMDKFCSSSDPVRPWLTAQLRGMPLGAFSQRLHLPVDTTHLPLLFVYCKANALGMFELARDRAASRPNARVVELNTQHAAMLTQPEAVADLLCKFASGVPSRRSQQDKVQVAAR